MDIVILILLVLHLLSACVYAWDWYQDNGRRQEAVIRLGISLCLPLLGVLLFKWIDYCTENNAGAQMDELYLGRGEMLDELDLLRPVDRAQEMNKAPAADVLAMSDYAQRRRLVMDTLRQEDTLDYVSVLQQALSNEDQETSHYASAVIMDLQNRIQDRLNRCTRSYQEDPSDPQRQALLEQELYHVMESGVFDRHTMARYQAQYSQLSDRLLAGGEIRSEWYHHRVRVDLQAGAALHAKATAFRFMEACPDNEDAVVDVIQACIQLSDRESLDRFLARLKDMPVMLTDKSLPYIRFLARQ